MQTPIDKSAVTISRSADGKFGGGEVNKLEELAAKVRAEKLAHDDLKAAAERAFDDAEKLSEKAHVALRNLSEAIQALREFALGGGE